MILVVVLVRDLATGIVVVPFILVADVVDLVVGVAF